MTGYRALWIALLLAHGGCTVTAVSARDDPRPRNSCTASDSCGKGEICSEGLCQSLNGELEAVLVTATPYVESTLPHLTFVSHLGDLPTSPSGEILFPGPANVKGSLNLPASSTCYPSFISDDPSRAILPSTDGTLPVSATLTLRQRLLGLSQQVYYAQTGAAPLNGYNFNLQVPSGEYDVYLVPPKRQKGDCVVPPQLYRSVPIGVKQTSDANDYEFPVTISKLNLYILWPKESASLEGWVADIIEPLGGNPISTELTLGKPDSLTDQTDEYAAPLSYSKVDSSSTTPGVTAVADLLRLRPPENLVAPTIFLQRTAFGLLQEAGEPVSLDIFSRYPSPVRVRGQMVRADDRRSVNGTLTLVSTAIFGVDDGVFGSFQTTVEVNHEGAIDVLLPPGKYHVQAKPNQALGNAPDTLSVLEDEWVVPLDVRVQHGRLLELTTTSAISGQGRVQGAEVQVVPSPQPTLAFEEAFGERPFTPRSTTTFVDEGGRFVLQVDPGRFDITMQAPQELGFGWFVRPGQRLGDQNQDLGRLLLPHPSVLARVASVGQPADAVPLASASIRAYAYLDENGSYTRDPTLAASVIQVAETQADETGAFRLLLPATIDAPR
jgi:hypothetical protein